MIVIVIVWLDDARGRQEAYGPFQAREDGSHIDEMSVFLKSWQAEHGQWIAATAHLVTPPGDAS